MSQEKEGITPYSYEDYLRDVNFYREKCWAEIRDRNNYILLGSAGGIVFLYGLLTKFTDKLSVFSIWFVIFVFALNACFCLFSIHQRTKVSEEYTKMYSELYNEFYNKDIAGMGEKQSEIINKSKIINCHKRCEKINDWIIPIYFMLLLVLMVIVLININKEKGGKEMSNVKIEKSIPPVMAKRINDSIAPAAVKKIETPKTEKIKEGD